MRLRWLQVLNLLPFINTQDLISDLAERETIITNEYR